MEITLDDIKRRLPDFDDFKSTDEYFLTLAKYIDKLWDSMKVFPELKEEQRKAVVVSLVAYYQDILADAGMWRAFITMCRKLYGKPVPFYKEPEDYIDCELNQIDLNFIIWYTLESSLGFNGLVSPFDSDIDRFARQTYKLFDYLYEDAPTPENFKSLLELELDDKEQAREIFNASAWLFWNSYFIRPVSKYIYEPEIDEEEELSIEETLTNELRLRTTFEQPTGPLALYVNEWLRLIIDNKLPKETKRDTTKKHKFYKSLVKATKGEPIAFCKDYEELNKFLSDKMEWGTPDEGGHLPQLKDSANFILFATPDKGLLIAHDIAQFVKHPNNPYYNQESAANEAHNMVMKTEVCPVDLVKYLFEKGYVPDAAFPTGHNGQALLHDNWDFLARLYLGKYYREH